MRVLRRCLCAFFINTPTSHIFLKNGIFKKPAPQHTPKGMKLIFSVQDCRILKHGPAPVEQILIEQGINPLDVIVSRNGMMISEDTVVEPDEEIRIISISHGG